MADVDKVSLKHRLRVTMTAQFVRAERAWAWVLCASLGALMLSIASVLIDDPVVFAVIDLLAVLLGVAVFSLRIRAQGLYGAAEELRRAHRHLESHGIRPRDLVVLNLPASLDRLDLGAASPEQPYYATTAAPGPRRLADILVETASYTHPLAQSTWRHCAALALGGLLLMIGLLWYGTVMGTGGTGLMRLVPHISSIIVLGFAADLGVAFWRLEQAAAQTVERLEAFRTNDNLRLEDLLPAVTDYDCALAATGAPIPDWIYAPNKGPLNEQWAINHAADSEPAGAVSAATSMGSPANSRVMAKREAREALRTLLFTVFDDDELRMFVSDLNDQELMFSLKGSAASFVVVVDSLVGALERRNEASPEFFAALERRRPRVANRIRDVARLWGA